MDKRQKYSEQAKVYEAYASKCIEDCDTYNERVACQLLLREIPLYGNVTCMQVSLKAILLHYFSTRFSDKTNCVRVHVYDVSITQ